MAIQLAESQQGGKSPANKHGAYWREYRGCVRGQKNRQADSSAAHRPSQNLRPGIPEAGNDSNLLIVFYVQIMPDDFVMQLHRF